MKRSKSTRGEVVAAVILALVAMGCAFVYVVGGGRVWVFGAVLALIQLIALVAGIAER